MQHEVDALRTYAQLARMRWEGGYTSYIEVFDAERSLFNAQLSCTRTQGTVFKSMVTLYKSTGGGWVIGAERMTAMMYGANGGPVTPEVAAPTVAAPASPGGTQERLHE